MTMSGTLESLSVLVTSYNKAEYIKSFSKWARALSSRNAELCIVDDFSSDGSDVQLADLAANLKNTKFVALKSNVGSAGARNACISLATRKFVFFLDIDDEPSLEVLESCLKTLAELNSDILVANLLVHPSGEALEMPLVTSRPVKIQLETIKTSLSTIMGYSRYIYSLSFIKTRALRFFPTRSENGGQYFILDDSFWLLQIGATSGNLVVTKSDSIIYHYYPPLGDSNSWNRYISQIINLPTLVKQFIEKHTLNPNLVPSKLITQTITWMFLTLRPLNVSQLLKSNIFSLIPWKFVVVHVKPSKILILFFNFLSLIGYSFKNSIRIRSRVNRP